MENQRLFLWLGLLFVLWLNVDAWMRDYSKPEAVPTAASAPAAPAASTLGNAPPPIPAAAIPPAVSPPAGAVPAAPGAAVAAAGGTAAEPVAPLAPVAQAIRVHTDVLDVVLSTAGGQVTDATLSQYPVAKDKPDVKVSLFNADSTDTLYLFQSGLTTGKAGSAEPNHTAIFSAPAAAFALAPGQDELKVPLTWTDGAGLTVMKTYVFHRGSYAVDIVQSVQNAGAAAVQLAPYAQIKRHWQHYERSMFNVESLAFRGPAVYDGEKYRKLDVEKDEDAKYSQGVKDGWLAVMQHHFVSAFVPAAGQAYQYSLTVQGRDFLLRAVGPAQSVAAGATVEVREHLFVGPKLQAQLIRLHPELSRTTDYGKWLYPIARPLFLILNWVHGVVGNWGWAIIIVTFLIKLVFYKLAETSGRSMAKMRTVAPRIKAMQERYKDDREQQAKALMELYKREKINPVAGCLPMVVQIPFFFAFYWVLLESVEMRQAPFMLWIQDLSSRDPYFVLPLLMGIGMFGQYKLNPTPPDPMQAKVFAFMPVVMTVMMAWFPAGLVLYWITNTVLSIAQQWKINRAIEAEDKKQRTG